jgi:hypothetical protein
MNHLRQQAEGDATRAAILQVQQAFKLDAWSPAHCCIADLIALFRRLQHVAMFAPSFSSSSAHYNC